MVTQTLPKANRTIFYPLTNEDVVMTSQGMTPAQQRVFFYLKTLTGPWTDREVEVRICDLARDLRMDRSTVSRALRYLKDQGMIDVRALVVGIRIRAANCEDCDRHAPDAIATHQMRSPHTPHIYKDRAHVLDSSDQSDPQSEGGKIFKEEEVRAASRSLLDDRLNTLYKAKDMGRGNCSGAVEIFQKKIEVESQGGPVAFRQEDIKVETQSSVSIAQESLSVQTFDQPVAFRQEDIKVRSGGGAVEVTQKHITVASYPSELSHLPLPLLAKISNLGIRFDDRVVALLKECHQSQISGALSHMENMDEEIRSPRDFFLSKAPKMPVEVGMGLPVYTAEDWQVDTSGSPSAAARAFAEKVQAENLRKKAALEAARRQRYIYAS